MPAKLKDLLSENTLEIAAKEVHLPPRDADVGNLSLRQLNLLGMVIMRGEVLMKVPNTILSAFAIEYLVEKAIEKNLTIF